MKDCTGGFETIVMHTAFNGFSPINWDRDGNCDPISFKVKLLSRYEEIINMNINVLEKCELETTVMNKFIFDDKIFHYQDWVIGFIEEYDFDTIDLKPVEIEIINCINKLKSKRGINFLFDLIPFLTIKDNDSSNVRHVYKFKYRIC